MNEQMDEFLDSSNPITQFLTNHKLLFFNEDNMMMCFNAN